MTTETFAARLQRLRQAKRLSARKLSTSAGLSPTHVGLIEAGDRSHERIAYRTICRLAGALEVTPDFLVWGTEVAA